MEQNRKVDHGAEKNDDKRAVDRKEKPPPLTETRARCQGGAVEIQRTQVLQKTPFLGGKDKHPKHDKAEEGKYSRHKVQQIFGKSHATEPGASASRKHISL
jgi:hypothetical protein